MVTRIGGERGQHLLTIAGKTVRGVVYGILGTALVQAVVAGIGFLIAGVPGVALLALLTFFSSIVPVAGTALTWLPASPLVVSSRLNRLGHLHARLGFGVANIDNVVKPWLISQGSDMPFILIFFWSAGRRIDLWFCRSFFWGRHCWPLASVC